MMSWGRQDGWTDSSRYLPTNGIVLTLPFQKGSVVQEAKTALVLRCFNGTATDCAAGFPVPDTRGWRWLYVPHAGHCQDPAGHRQSN